jgi:hypothetical protein
MGRFSLLHYETHPAPASRPPHAFRRILDFAESSTKHSRALDEQRTLSGFGKSAPRPPRKTHSPSGFSRRHTGMAGRGADRSKILSDVAEECLTIVKSTWPVFR